jgi:hypothetical protein
VSGRGRLAFVGACLLVFALVAAWVNRSTPATAPSGKAPPAGAPGTAGPAGLAVADLNDVGELQQRFNADKGVPRLVLALSPT